MPEIIEQGGGEVVDIGPVLPGTPVPAGQILWECLFTFSPQPGQAAGVNDGWAVTTLVLDSAGNPVVLGGVPQVPTTTGVVGIGGGSDQYRCVYACEPGFTGEALATLTTGPNAGQEDAQPINLGAAVDLSDVSFAAGPAQTNVQDLTSCFLEAGSDGWLHVLITGAGNQPAADGTFPAVIPIGNPVSVAVTPAAPAPPDFQTADWLSVPSGPAAGSYARLHLSALAGNTLAAGRYRVSVQIGGGGTVRASADVFARD